jgi:hypothetical protein
MRIACEEAGDLISLSSFLEGEIPSITIRDSDCIGEEWEESEGKRQHNVG